MPEKREDELKVLRRIAGGAVTEAELVQFSEDFSNRLRIQVALIQHPRFPQKRALNIIPALFPGDLMRVIRNKRTNPLVRKRAEQEFINKFQRLPMGEKISCVKTAPPELLRSLPDLRDSRLITAVLANPRCTEQVVLDWILGPGDHHALYLALDGSPWLRRPAVVSAVSRDPQAPVKTLLALVPLLRKKDREMLLRREGTHGSVRDRIERLKQRG